jgi:predicted dehydrogenase
MNRSVNFSAGGRDACLFSQANQLGLMIARTVLHTAPISTMNMTGLRQSVRGSSLRRASGVAFHNIFGSSSPPPTRVFAECIGGGSRFRGDDNVAITLRFADGSIATVLYTALGDSRLGKEYLEVYGEGSVAILDDFRTLLLSKRGKQQRIKAANQDKGFEAEMKRFVAAAKSGGPMPIPFEQLALTTRATLAVLESLRSGAPVDL